MKKCQSFSMVSVFMTFSFISGFEQLLCSMSHISSMFLFFSCDFYLHLLQTDQLLFVKVFFTASQLRGLLSLSRSFTLPQIFTVIHSLRALSLSPPPPLPPLCAKQILPVLTKDHRLRHYPCFSLHRCCLTRWMFQRFVLFQFCILKEFMLFKTKTLTVLDILQIKGILLLWNQDFWYKWLCSD